jgi:hypothetical protein
MNTTNAPKQSKRYEFMILGKGKKTEKLENLSILSKFRPSKAFPSLAQLVTAQPIRIAPLR